MVAQKIVFYFLIFVTGLSLPLWGGELMFPGIFSSVINLSFLFGLIFILSLSFLFYEFK